MHSDPNARLTQKGRFRLVTQHLEHGRSLPELAAEDGYCSVEAFGYSLRWPFRWLARYRSGGPTVQADRCKVLRTQRRALDPQQLQQAVDLSKQRLQLWHVARLLRAPSSTVAKPSILWASAVCEIWSQGCRCSGTSGIGLETSSTWTSRRWPRFRQVGHRITGDRQQGHSYRVGYDKLHVAVDDATRLAYIEVLEDEQKPTVIGFLDRAVAWLNAHGVECRRVMSDKGSAYVSKAFAKACLQGPGTPDPYTPRTNGKAERFIQTLCREWAYVMSFQNSDERSHWLPRYLGIYNRLRMDSALGWRSQQPTVTQLRSVNSRDSLSYLADNLVRPNT